MDHDAASDPTREIYDRVATEWQARRTPAVPSQDAADLLGATAPAEGAVADLGCGPGWYTRDLLDHAASRPVVALDSSRAMLRLATAAAPGSSFVQADLRALPFPRGSLAAAFASKSYVHVARSDLPLALADLHRALAPGARLYLHVFRGDTDHGPFPDDDFPGRRFSSWPEPLLRDVVVGAGFTVDRWEVRQDPDRPDGGGFRVTATRARTLPDTVGPGMRLLVCGLNPSLYSADAGIGFARPGNRFWAAAIAAGIASRDRDPVHALRHHGTGMTDMVKRATPRADALDRPEYVEGMRRIEQLAAWLRPGAVCFVGLAGWRAAVDRRATAGPQPRDLGGRPVYVMPSTSGLNARTPRAVLADHLRAAHDLGGAAVR